LLVFVLRHCPFAPLLLVSCRRALTAPRGASLGPLWVMCCRVRRTFSSRSSTATTTHHSDQTSTRHNRSVCEHARGCRNMSKDVQKCRGTRGALSCGVARLNADERRFLMLCCALSSPSAVCVVSCDACVPRR
jgi:hypothetical protein